MSELLFDFRDAVRGFRRDRLYAMAVVGTLALTLGASTAVFSIFNGVLLQPLAYRESQRLVSIREINLAAADRYPTLPVNPRPFQEWRARTASVSPMGPLFRRPMNLTPAG